MFLYFMRRTKNIDQISDEQAELKHKIPKMHRSTLRFQAFVSKQNLAQAMFFLNTISPGTFFPVIDALKSSGLVKTCYVRMLKDYSRN